MTESDLRARNLRELRNITFAPERKAQDLVALMRHWSGPQRELRAQWPIDTMLKAWVVRVANPNPEEFHSLFRLFYRDPDDDDTAPGDFNRYLHARYKGEAPPSIPLECRGTNGQQRHCGRRLDECPRTGVLATNEYHVGKSGPTLAKRRRTLDHIFTSALAPIPSQAEVEPYGAPLSERRLQRMAYVIAAFRDAPRSQRAAEMEVAVYDWNKDLEYLERNYHAGWFAFDWPVCLAVG